VEEIFDRAVLLVIEENTTDAVEITFSTFKERENYRIRLYKQKTLLKAVDAETARKIRITAITDAKKGEFKIQLFYSPEIKFKIVKKERRGKNES
jgi:hypothetical protein